MTEQTSAEKAGGTAAGIKGKVYGFNADTQCCLKQAMLEIGNWVNGKAGTLLGHIKMSVTVNGFGMTMNLTDLDEGVLCQGELDPCPEADFNFMAAVLDVDHEELEHMMIHALEDCGADVKAEVDHDHHHHGGPGHVHVPGCNCCGHHHSE
jgi:hypothetical protein